MEKNHKTLILILLLSTLINKSFCAQQNSQSKSNEVIFQWFGLIYSNLYIWGQQKIQSECEKIKKIFQSGVSVNIEIHNSNTPLMIAANYSQLNDLTKWLVENGTDINHKNNNGYTALTFSRISKNKPIEEFLISHGATKEDKADIHILFKLLRDSNRTPFINQDELQSIVNKIKEIFDSGVSVNITNSLGNTALIEVAGHARLTDFAKYLINKGANINAQDKLSGFTPLRQASLGSNLELAKIFINHGANVNHITGERGSILYESVFTNELYASPPASRDTIKLLLINGATFNDAKFQEALAKHSDAAKMFNEILDEIKKEYKDKLQKKLRDEISTRSGILPDLANIVAQYAGFTDEEIIPNIIEIRKLLNEIPIQAAAQQQPIDGGGAAAAAQ